MKKKYDVTALGELLIDFTQNGISEQGNPLFEACPGGAPCNVLAMLNRLGRKTAFIGKVGNDMFGHMLRQVVSEAGVDVQGLCMDEETRTTLAFVQTFEDGDRDFSFYRNPGADMMLTEEELPPELLQNTSIFHFGSLSMTHPEVRKATRKAIAGAKEHNALISFDPNLREPLWKSLDDAREQMEYGLSVCDILKIADNEIEFLTEETDFDKGAAILQKRFPNLKILNVTAGAEGSYAYHEGKRVFMPSYRLGGTIETTGAGDTFCACILHYVLEHGAEHLSVRELEDMLRFANAAAYLVTTKKGAIRAMPAKEEVLEIIS